MATPSNRRDRGQIQHGYRDEKNAGESDAYEPADVLLERILAERRRRWIEDAAEKARAKAEQKARKAGKPWTDTDNAATLDQERAKARSKK